MLVFSASPTKLAIAASSSSSNSMEVTVECWSASSRQVTNKRNKFTALTSKRSRKTLCTNPFWGSFAISYASTWNTSSCWRVSSIGQLIEWKPRFGTSWMQYLCQVNSWPASTWRWWFFCCSQPLQRSRKQIAGTCPSCTSTFSRFVLLVTRFLKKTISARGAHSSQSPWFSSYGENYSQRFALTSRSIICAGCGLTLLMESTGTKWLSTTCCNLSLTSTWS